MPGFSDVDEVEGKKQDQNQKDPIDLLREWVTFNKIVKLYDCGEEDPSYGGVYWTILERGQSSTDFTPMRPRPGQCKVVSTLVKSILESAKQSIDKTDINIIYEPPGVGKTMMSLVAMTNIISKILFDDAYKSILQDRNFLKPTVFNQNQGNVVVGTMIVPLSSLAQQIAEDFTRKYAVAIPTPDGYAGVIADIVLIIGKRNYVCPYFSLPDKIVRADEPGLYCTEMPVVTTINKRLVKFIADPNYVLFSATRGQTDFESGSSFIPINKVQLTDALVREIESIHDALSNMHGSTKTLKLAYNADGRLRDALENELKNNTEIIEYQAALGSRVRVIIRKEPPPMSNKDDSKQGPTNYGIHMCDYIGQFYGMFHSSYPLILVMTYEEWLAMLRNGKLPVSIVMTIDEIDEFIERTYPHIRIPHSFYDELEALSARHGELAESQNLVTFFKTSVKNVLPLDKVYDIELLIKSLADKLELLINVDKDALHAYREVKRLYNEVQYLRELATDRLVLVRDNDAKEDILTIARFHKLFTHVAGASSSILIHMTATPLPEQMAHEIFGAKQVRYIQSRDELYGYVIIPNDRDVMTYKYPGKYIKMLAKKKMTEDDLYKTDMSVLIDIANYVSAYLRLIVLAHKYVKQKYEKEEIGSSRVIGILSSNSFGEMLLRTMHRSSRISELATLNLVDVANLLGVDVYLLFGDVSLKISPGGSVTDVSKDTMNILMAFRRNHDPNFVVITSKVNRGYDLYGGGAMVIDRMPNPAMTSWRVQHMRVLDRFKTNERGEYSFKDTYTRFAARSTVLQYIGRMLRSPTDKAVVMSPDMRLMDIIELMTTIGIDTSETNNDGKKPLKVKAYIAKSVVDPLQEDKLQPFNKALMNEKYDWLSTFYGVIVEYRNKTLTL